MHLDCFVLGLWVHISSGHHCSAVPCLETETLHLGRLIPHWVKKGNQQPGKDKTSNSKLGSLGMNGSWRIKLKILIKELRLGFLSFWSTSQNKLTPSILYRIILLH
ncbi:hypothetical protein BGX38DRAFT_1329025 [Terfezia claveryi]|nr:hypothetical protein BGX38DRAFT_1329025 [Terfezia claveryi]